MPLELAQEIGHQLDQRRGGGALAAGLAQVAQGLERFALDAEIEEGLQNVFGQLLGLDRLPLPANLMVADLQASHLQPYLDATTAPAKKAGDPPRPISQATRRKRWRDVDLSTGMVSIRNTQAHSTKTGRERSIPLVGEARKVLARRYQAKTADTSVIGLDDPVLTDAAGHAIKPHRASSRFKHFIRKTGLDDRLRLHDLRHTCASWMVQRGESLYTVQAILGHSTPVVAQRYSHLAPDAMRAAMERAFGNG